MGKILFWIDNEWIRFCIAKALQDISNHELYAIIDIRYTSTKFFQEQKIVNFKQQWFYRDYIKKSQEVPDINYLKQFEDKYKINLWELAYAERFFYKYNEYYKFSDKEILSILERECKLFEDILDQAKPDCLIIKLTDSHQSNLMVKLCKAKGIKVLIMGPTRFSYKYDIYDEYDKPDLFLNNESSNNTKTLTELQSYLKEYQSIKDIDTFKKRSKLSVISRIKKYVKFFKLIRNKDFQDYYANYGKTGTKIVSRLYFIKRPLRKRFIDRTFLNQIPDEPFIYYPLHADPERSVSLVAPFYMDQISVITNIAKAIPIGYKLYIKEHPGMFEYAWREKEYYKQLLDLPNIRLIHPSIPSEELLKKCSLVITLTGTTGLEAAFYNKPSIVFADVSYTVLPSVYRIKSMEDLPKAIQIMLTKQVDLNSLNKYVDTAERQFLNIKLWDIYLDFNDYFSNDIINGFILNMADHKMMKFIESHKEQLKQIAQAHLDKMI